MFISGGFALLGPSVSHTMVGSFGSARILSRSGAGAAELWLWRPAIDRKICQIAGTFESVRESGSDVPNRIELIELIELIYLPELSLSYQGWGRDGARWGELAPELGRDELSSVVRQIIKMTNVSGETAPELSYGGGQDVP